MEVFILLPEQQLDLVIFPRMEDLMLVVQMLIVVVVVVELLFISIHRVILEQF